MATEDIGRDGIPPGTPPSAPFPAATSQSDAAPKTYELMVCGWDRNPRHCVYLNDYRIAGGKPWGGAQSETHWHVTMEDLANAIPDIHLMREALRKIAAGEGVYGAQAHEYKELARAALSKAEAGQ